MPRRSSLTGAAPRSSSAGAALEAGLSRGVVLADAGYGVDTAFRIPGVPVGSQVAVPAAFPCRKALRAQRQPSASGLGNRWRYSNRSALKDNRNLIGRRLAIRLGARLGGGEEELQRVLERRGLGNVTERPGNTSRAEVPSNRRRLHAGNRPAHRLSAARHHLGLVR